MRIFSLFIMFQSFAVFFDWMGMDHMHPIDFELRGISGGGVRIHLPAAPVTTNIKFIDKKLTPFQELYSGLLEQTRKEMSAYSSDKLLSELMENYSHWGMNFCDPIMMTPCESFKDLLSTLEGRISPEDLNEKLLNLLVTVKVFNDNLLFDNLKIDKEGMKTLIDGVDYVQLLQDKIDKKELSLENTDLLELHKNLESVVDPTLNYLDPSDSGDCKRKFKDLAYFFNEMTGEKDFIKDNQGWGNYGGSYDGRPLAIKKAALYKLKRLSQKTLDRDQKLFLVPNFMHASRHCNDAKKYYVDASYSVTCFLENAQDQLTAYPEEDRFAQSYYLAKTVKENALEDLIQSKIEIKRGESITIFNSTWDKISIHVGLDKKNSPYSMGTELTEDQFLEYYTPEKLIENYSKSNGRRLVGDYAQGLQDFINKEKFLKLLSISELQLYGHLTSLE